MRINKVQTTYREELNVSFPLPTKEERMTLKYIAVAIVFVILGIVQCIVMPEDSMPGVFLVICGAYFLLKLIKGDIGKECDKS